MAFDKDLPDEFAQAAKPRPEEIDMALLEALGISISAMRKEAVDARRASGIEEV